VPDARLWYCVAGKAAAAVAPAVYLHGGPGYSSYSFAALAGPRLERQLQMVYFDQRGSGYSERPASQNYTIATLVEDVESLRKALGVAQISVIGHSWGGLLALEYAAVYPERVARIVLAGPSADLPAACTARVTWLAVHKTQALASARQKLSGDCALAFRALQGEELASYNDAVMFPDPKQRALNDQADERSGLKNTGELQRALVDAGLFDYRFRRSAELTLPVLIIAGLHDFAIGLSQQRALAAALPHARLQIYERGGHFMYLDEPERFAGDVVRFLAVRADSSAQLPTGFIRRSATPIVTKSPISGGASQSTIGSATRASADRRN